MKAIRAKKIESEEEMKEAMAIRTKVFVEEQQVPPEMEYDEHETESTHYLATLQDAAIGTARWRHTSKGVKLERFAVLKPHRGKGVGKILVEQVLYDLENESKTIYLHAQVQVILFYEKMGFETKGDYFEEAGIQHKVMVLKGR